MHTRFPSIAAALQHHAETRPDDPAYHFLDDRGRAKDSLTFAELDRRADGLAARLRATAGPGDRALLAFPAGLEFVVGFFACQYAGVAAVPLIQPRQGRLRDSTVSVVTDCAPKLGLTDVRSLESVQAAFAALPDAGVEWHGIDLARPEPPPDAPVEPDPDGLAFLQYTSGSTSAPKGVMVSQSNLCANLEMISLSDRLGRGSTRVGWIPLYHDMGLIFNALQGTYAGALCVLMAARTFVQRPLSWLRAIHDYRAEMAIAPNFAYDLCLEQYRPERLKGVDLSCWELALNGAEPVRAETIERFARTFGAHGLAPAAPHPTYGMAEATLMISGGRRTGPPRLWTVERDALARDRAVVPRPGQRHQTLVGCGRSLPGERIAIVDPVVRRRLETGEVGEIWVHGPHVARGYWANSEATEETFRARVIGEPDALWLRTGDLGCQDSSGELYITGRIKDVIIVRGANHYPQDIELTAERSHAALRRGFGAAFAIPIRDGEGLAVAYEVRDEYADDVDVDELREAIRQAVVLEHELTVHEVILTPQGSIPKTTSGKVRRKAARELWQSGELPTLSDPRRAAAPRDAVPAAGSPGVPAS